MNTNCCVTSVPHPHGSFKVLPRATSAWEERLQAGLGRVINASDQNMGHLEEEILQKTRELERAVLEEASQKKADARDCGAGGAPRGQKGAREASRNG